MDESWELAEPTELERDILGFAAQWLDDLGLDVDASARPDGAGRQVVVTTAIRSIGGAWQWLRPPVEHPDVDAWRAWVEEEFCPSWYR